MSILSKIMSITKTKKKLNRIRIKPICLSSNTLFQVPFTSEYVKRYKQFNNGCNDCLFQVLTALGLRHYSVSKKDSRKILIKKSKGVEVHDAAKYLSTIFGANIQTIHVNPFNRTLEKEKLTKKTEKEQELTNQSLASFVKLENGYGTFVCGVYYHALSESFRGHFFIIHKENDKLYYFDQSTGNHSKEVSKMFGTRTKFVSFWAYQNLSKETKCVLNKEKINEEITIDNHDND